MADKKKKPRKKDMKPDGRGPRPRDVNALAKWVVDQTTETTTSDEKKQDADKQS